MIAELLLSSGYTVILTGAGISTESGIPDFRSKGTGLWNSKEFMKFAYPQAIRDDKEGFTNFYKTTLENIEGYKPNKGHEILAKWEREGLVNSIVTQNIDEFHQLAGSEKVIEIHGTIRRMNCNECGKEYSAEEYISNQGTVCSCGGFIRPSIVLFTEAVKYLEEAIEEASRAELFIVLGTSLTVFPAAELPYRAKSNGAKVVIINEEPTDGDKYADVVVNGRKIGQVLSEIDDELVRLRNLG